MPCRASQLGVAFCVSAPRPGSTGEIPVYLALAIAVTASDASDCDHSRRSPLSLVHYKSMDPVRRLALPPGRHSLLWPWLSLPSSRCLVDSGLSTGGMVLAGRAGSPVVSVSMLTRRLASRLVAVWPVVTVLVAVVAWSANRRLWMVLSGHTHVPPPLIRSLLCLLQTQCQ